MYDMRNKVHPMILRYLRDRFSDALFETLIQVDTKLRESPAFAKPINKYAPNTRAACQYRALAKELISDLELGKRGETRSVTGAGEVFGPPEPGRSALKRAGEKGDGGSGSVVGRESRAKAEDQRGRIREAVLGGNGR
jgi:hypothetical protein